MENDPVRCTLLPVREQIGYSVWLLTVCVIYSSDCSGSCICWYNRYMCSCIVNHFELLLLSESCSHQSKPAPRSNELYLNFDVNFDVDFNLGSIPHECIMFSHCNVEHLPRINKATGCFICLFISIVFLLCIENTLFVTHSLRHQTRKQYESQGKGW